MSDHDFDATADANELELRSGTRLSSDQSQATEEVNAIPYDEDENWEGFEDDGDSALPGRPRRVYLNRWTGLLAAVILGAACFYAGVRVEKSKVPSSSGGTGLAALASRFGAAGSGAAAGSRASAGGTSRFAGGGGFAGGGFGGAGGAGAGATAGTISSIDGDTVYVTDTAGNTVAVKLTSSTTIKKSESVSSGHLYPGDTLVVVGATKNGTVTATSVTDSGASTTGSSAGSGAAAGSGGASGGAGSSTSSSGLSSLF